MAKLKCSKCGHEWEYTGNSEYYVTCPKCHNKKKIEKIEHLGKNQRVQQEE